MSAVRGSTMSTPRFRVFPNGSSWMDWMAMNCDRCVKRFDPEKHHGANSPCDLENSIALASATDGTLLHGGYTPINKADAVARRLNWDGRSYLENKCPEFVP